MCSSDLRYGDALGPGERDVLASLAVGSSGDLPVERAGETRARLVDAGVRCLRYDGQHNVVFSGSWDRTIGGWDPRAAQGSVATAEVPGKVFALDLAFGGSGTKLVVGTSDRHVVIFDARNLSTPLQHRESSLKHQTRCLRCFPDASGYALSSIEGRVSVEYFSDEDQPRKYAFKCHRAGKVVYPVKIGRAHV